MQGWKKWEWKFVDEKLGNKVLRSRSAAYDSCFAHNAHCCLLRLHPLLYCLHNCSTDFSSLGFNYACQAFKKVTSNQKSDFFLDPIEHGSLFFNGPKLGEPLVFRPPALPPFLAPYVMASYQVVWVKSTAKIQFVIYLKRLFFLVYWESCRSSATYDLWLKAESWSLNFKRRIIGKIQKTFFSGEVIFGGQNPKNAKKNFKNFYCPKSFVRSYRSFIYL